MVYWIGVSGLPHPHGQCHWALHLPPATSPFAPGSAGSPGKVGTQQIGRHHGVPWGVGTSLPNVARVVAICQYSCNCCTTYAPTHQGRWGPAWGPWAAPCGCMATQPKGQGLLCSAFLAWWMLFFVFRFDSSRTGRCCRYQPPRLRQRYSSPLFKIPTLDITPAIKDLPSFNYFGSKDSR